MIGQAIGRWRLVEELGEGSFGRVWRVESTPDQEGALKLFHRQSAGFAERAMHEATALARIAHPNLAEILDMGRVEAGVADGAEWFLVTRFIAGGSLRRRLGQDKVLPPRRAVAIARGIARGLQAMHAQGLLHRDIKPSNVMLPAGKPDDAAVLVDLGLAGFVSQETRTTQAGQLFGTPAYMAPEQAGARPQDVRTDVWGLGVLLYEMINGRTPFARPSFAETLMAVVSEELPVSAADPTLNAILARALAKKPEERFGSVAELMMALEAWSRSAPAPSEETQAPAMPAPAVGTFAPADNFAATGTSTYAPPPPVAIPPGVTQTHMPVPVPGPYTPVHSTPVAPPPASKSAAMGPAIPVALGAALLVAGVALVLRLRPGEGGRAVPWLLAAGVTAIVGLGTLLLLRRRQQGAPAMRDSLARVKQKSDRRQLVTESLAISMDELLGQSRDNPQLGVITASLAIEIDQYTASTQSGDRQRALENVIRLVELVERRMAKKSWLERYDKVVASAAAGVALAGSLAGLRKELFAADGPPVLVIDGCPTETLPVGRKVHVSARWEHPPSPAPAYTWYVEGEPAGTGPMLTWTTPNGGDRGWEINAVAPGYRPAICVVQVKP